MNEPMELRMLERAAHAARDNHHLLAFALAQWLPRATDLQGVAVDLGLPAESVWRLALCGRPRAECWMEDVERLAKATRVEFFQLLCVMRQLESAEALQARDTKQHLLAARRDYRAGPPETVGNGDGSPGTEDDPTTR